MIPSSFRLGKILLRNQQITRLIETDATTSSGAAAAKPSATSRQSDSFPEAPDPLSCCGSGCANCVWIQYANEVNEYFSKKEHNSKAHKILDKYKAVKEEMEKNIKDENLRAFLLMEVKAKLTKK